MAHIAGFGEVNQVSVTVLVDNRADLLVRSTDSVKYYTDAPLLAEHGFAALIDLPDSGERILWDGGASQVVAENLKRMKLDPTAITQIALSHGHWDHAGGMCEILRAMSLRPQGKEWPPEATAEEMSRYAEGRRVPLLAHPAAFRERWGFARDGKKSGPSAPPPRAEWEALGAQVMLSEGPHQLAPGCWATGHVPRRSFEQSGRSPTRRYRQGSAFLSDDIEDDQAIVLNVRGKGLVVVAGCAHAGILNTIRYAQEISGVERVWGVLGGFHLAPASDEEMERTVAEIVRLAPALIAPTHCTGLKAIGRFAAEMPAAFAQSVSGATYLF
jgi:7,8-dihydropterin-6-yl-methyl-4-(beta-D-ribofuranosyl)aminobenzene 5'-phosphate synthase